MAPQSDSHYFSDISNAVIINPSVTHVSGCVGNSHSESERHGLKLLLANICTGAFHDAAERGDPPRCHPDTRIAIRAEIMEWVQAPAAMRKLVLWMYGPAGAGKTAIAQSIAEECTRQGLIAASFFFGRAAIGRNDTSRFVATIAYQLSLFIPEIFDQIISAIENDQTIFSRALATQMRVLVVEPLQSLPPSPRPIFMITDGVDECGPDRESQTILLDTLGSAILELRHIPLIFLVASRPEYEIREAFNGDLLGPLVRPLVLNDTYEPDKDIRLFLDSTFRKIRDKHLRLDSCLPSPWPATADVDRLVSKASGQFIFASTVMKFIDSSRHHPQARLDVILGLSAPGNETPFALLDALYIFILSSVADISKVLEVFMILMFGNDIGLKPLSLKLGAEVVEELLGSPLGTTLVDMHALVHVPPAGDRESVLRFHHASLYDFLTDRSRSRDYYIDPIQAHITLSRRWLKLIGNFSRTSVSVRLPFHVRVSGFIVHCKGLPASNNEIATDFPSFSLKKPLEEIRGLKDFWSTKWDEFFMSITEQVRTRADLSLQMRLLHEFDAFILKSISRYPPALRELIPSILSFRGKSSQFVQQIVSLIFYAMYPLEDELTQARHIDATSLQLLDMKFNEAFPSLFLNRSRAGPFYVDGKSFVKLMKTIIMAVYSPPVHKVTLVDGTDFQFNPLAGEIYAGSDMLIQWLEYGCVMASTDKDLALLLQEYTIRKISYNSSTARKNIAKISLKYITRCGIPYLQHKFLCDCFICVEEEGAKVHWDHGDEACIEHVEHAKAKPVEPKRKEKRLASIIGREKKSGRFFKKIGKLFPS